MTGELSSVGGRRAAGDVIIQVAGRVFNLVLGVVVTVLIVRLLGDEGYGEWSTAFAIIGIGGYFADFGFEQVAVRRAAAEPEREAEWIGALLTLRFALAVPVTFLCIAVLLLMANNSDMREAGLLICLTPLLTSANVLRTAFQLRVRNDVPTALVTVNSILWTVAVVLIWFADAGIVTLAAAFLLTGTITAMAEGVLALRVAKISIRGTAKLWGELAKVGLSVGIAGLLTLAYARIDQLLVFQLAGEHDAGEYGAAYRLLDSAQFLPIAVMTTMFPILSAAYPGNMGRVRTLVDASAEYLAMASLPALAFALAAGQHLTDFLFGPEFSDSAVALKIFMGVFVLICFGYLVGNLVLVLDLQRRFIRYAAIALVFNVTVNLIVIPEHGFVGAAWVTLATEVLILALSSRMVIKKLGFGLRLSRILRAALAAAVMGVTVYWLDQTGAPLGVLAAVSVTLYPLLLLASGALVPRELRYLMRKEME